MDKSKWYFIRTEKLLEGFDLLKLEELEENVKALIEAIDGEVLLIEATLQDLERDIVRGFPRTKKRQYATGPIRILKKQYTAFRPTNNLLVSASAFNPETNMTYFPEIFFEDIQYEDEDTNDNVTFVGVDGDRYHIQPPGYRNNNARVRCSCLDFHWRFARTNAKKGALFGELPSIELFRRKTDYYPSVNPSKVIGVCKHLLSLSRELEEDNMVVKVSRTTQVPVASFKPTTVVPPTEEDIPPEPKGEPTPPERGKIEDLTAKYDDARKEYERAQHIPDPNVRKQTLQKLITPLKDLYGKIRGWGAKFPRWMRNKLKIG